METVQNPSLLTAHLLHSTRVSAEMSFIRSELLRAVFAMSSKPLLQPLRGKARAASVPPHRTLLLTAWG